jgi:predicted nucleic-acid-binding protein
VAAFDTNVLVRSLVGDDAAQTKKAERARVGKAELADYIILGRAAGVGAELFTFDRRLARENGVTLL